MQALLAALLLAAAPAPKTLLTHGPVKLLELTAERPVPLLAKGAEVVILLEGAALVPIQPNPAPLRAGSSVFAPNPGSWWLTPQPRVRALILALPTPPKVLATTVRSEQEASRYKLGAQGEVVLMLDKALTGTDAFSQQRLTFQPGATVSAHKHPGSAELLYAISGEAEITIEGETKRLKPGEAIAIPAGAQHAAKVVSREPHQLIQFYVPGGPEQRFRAPAGGGAGGNGGKGGKGGAPDAGVTSGAKPR